MADYDLVVIGAGPGGYVAAIRAAQLGLKTACVERESALGGTCLRVGCIPSKALLESSELYADAKSSFASHGIKVGGLEFDLAAMLKRKEQIVSNFTRGVDGLLKKNKVARLTGHVRLLEPGRVEVEGKEGKQVIQARHIILATGSKPASLPGSGGGKVGIDRDAPAFVELNACVFQPQVIRIGHSAHSQEDAIAFEGRFTFAFHNCARRCRAGASHFFAQPELESLAGEQLVSLGD